jgi:enolase
MPETTITNVHHRTVYDSRGMETLEVDVITQKGFGRVAALFGRDAG